MTRLKTAREEGIAQGKVKMAEKMLKRGDSIDDIVDITELAREKVIELKKKYQN